MGHCVYHPGRTSVITLYGKDYCAPCKDDIAAARVLVDQHVEPKECFVWYQGANDWEPITGTGCAHWVAHQLGIQNGSAGDQCMAGMTYRVRVLIQGRTAVGDINRVQVNNIYVTPAVDHMGLVIAVTPSPKPGTAPTITIRHDSSRQHGVSTNDYATYFNGRGTFYR